MMKKGRFTQALIMVGIGLLLVGPVPARASIFEEMGVGKSSFRFSDIKKLMPIIGPPVNKNLIDPNPFKAFFIPYFPSNDGTLANKCFLFQLAAQLGPVGNELFLFAT